jgi:hypothetical protein
MKIAFDSTHLVRWWILLPAVAAPVASACFLDTGGIGGGGSGTGGGGSGGMTSTSSTTSSTTGGMDGGGDGDASLCGNGMIDPGENCDGMNLNGMTCTSLGYGGGTLTCSPSCKFVTAGCSLPTNWYDPAWHHRRLVTIDHTHVAGNPTNFPVALTVSDGSLLGQLQTSGADVLITDGSGKTKLAHEIELFDVNAGTLVVWVNVPALSASSDTTLYLYYANPTCPDQENVAGVWDMHDQVVLHLGEPATAGGTTTSFRDSTGHGHTGAQQGTATGAGRIGRAQTFDGLSQFVELASPDNVVVGTAGCTISAWIKTMTTANTTILAKAQGATNSAGDKFLYVSTSQVAFASFNVATEQASVPVNDGQWHHAVWTQTAGTPASWDIYVDGNHGGPWSVTPSADPSGFNLRVGAQVGTFGFFSGTIDEVRVADTPRSLAWIQTSFNNQGNPGTFYTVGPEQP